MAVLRPSPSRAPRRPRRAGPARCALAAVLLLQAAMAQAGVCGLPELPGHEAPAGAEPAAAPAGAGLDAAPAGAGPAAAAQALPLLRLPPSLLPATPLSLTQRLTVFRLDQPEAAPQVVDVLLEMDRQGLRLAGFAASQRVLLMQWDGHHLEVQRHPRLPREVDEARMLRDMTLVFWPAPAVQAALASPWTWAAQAPGHDAVLAYGGQRCLTVSVQGRLEADSRTELVNLREGYRLLIESRPAEATP